MMVMVMTTMFLESWLLTHTKYHDDDDDDGDGDGDDDDGDLDGDVLGMLAANVHQTVEHCIVCSGNYI